MYNQKIITMVSIANLSVADRKLIAVNNAMICRSLGLTGRVFVNGVHGLSVVEGTAEATQKYCDALESDPRVQQYILHSCRHIKTPEFSDYIVGIDREEASEPDSGVKYMEPQTLSKLLPSKLSASVKMMIDTYVLPVM